MLVQIKIKYVQMHENILAWINTYIVLINVIICITYLDLICWTFIQSRAGLFKILILFLILKYRNSLKSYGKPTNGRPLYVVRVRLQ